MDLDSHKAINPPIGAGKRRFAAGRSSHSAESLQDVRSILEVHLSAESCDDAISRWTCLIARDLSGNAMFNSIVEFTREIATAHNLDTIAKQNIRSGMFQRLLRPRC